MKYLLDTHAFLWFCMDSPHLSNRAREIMVNMDHQLFLSVASVWEMVIKFQLGKLELPVKPEIFIPEQMEANEISSLPISIFHAFETGALPDIHKDPFDRMLAAQSKVENMPLLTADRIFTQYGVEVLW